MALELADRPVYRITVEQALRIADAGIFRDEARLELLLGVFVDKPLKSAEHESVKRRLIRWLWSVGPDALRFEGPLIAPDGISMPEPDLAVVEPGDDRPHPTTALLVIEVAKTSIKLDTTIKPPLYAAAGVPDYWVVDVVKQRVIVFRDPSHMATDPRRSMKRPARCGPCRSTCHRWTSHSSSAERTPHPS